MVAGPLALGVAQLMGMLRSRSRPFLATNDCTHRVRTTNHRFLTLTKTAPYQATIKPSRVDRMRSRPRMVPTSSSIVIATTEASFATCAPTNPSPPGRTPDHWVRTPPLLFTLIAAPAYGRTTYRDWVTRQATLRDCLRPDPVPAPGRSRVLLRPSTPAGQR